MNIILTILVFIILIIFLFSLKINEKFKCDSGKYKKILIHDLNLQFKEGDTGTTVDTKYFKNYTDEALFNNIIKTMNTILNNTVSFSLFKLLDEDVYKNMEYYYKFKGTSGTREIVDDYKIREFMNNDIEELQTLLNNPIDNDRITTLLRMMINNQYFKKLNTNEDIIHIVLIPCFYNYTKNEIMVFEHLGEKYILLSLYKKQDNRYVRTLKSIDYDELSYNWVHGHISNKHKKDIFEKKNKNLSDEKKRQIDDYNNEIKINNDSIKEIQENTSYITLIKEKTELDKKIKILRKNITDLIETNYYSDQRVLKLRKFRGKKIDAELFPELYIEHINTITPETLLKKKRELNKGFKGRPAIVITYKTLIEKQIAYLKKLDLVKINQYQSELQLQETKIKNLMGKKIYKDYSDTYCVPDSNVKNSNIDKYSSSGKKGTIIDEAKQKCNSYDQCKGFTLRFNKNTDNKYQFILKKNTEETIKPGNFYKPDYNCYIKNENSVKLIETKISEIQTKTEELNAKLKELYNETITCLERKRNQKVIDQLSGELSKTNKYIKDLYVPFNLCNILKNYIIIYGNTFKYTKLVNSVSMILNLQLFPLKIITFTQELLTDPQKNYIDSTKFDPSSGDTELITELIDDYIEIKDQKYENQELHLKEIKKNIIGELIKIKQDMVKKEREYNKQIDSINYKIEKLYKEKEKLPAGEVAKIQKEIDSFTKVKEEIKNISGPKLKIYSMDDEDKICALEWGAKTINDRIAKWDCDNSDGNTYHGDYVFIENDKIYSMAYGEKCVLEWGNKIDSNKDRIAKWDCDNSDDNTNHGYPVFIENDKIYSFDNKKKRCVLEWGNKIDSNKDRIAKWDCDNSDDNTNHGYPVFIGNDKNYLKILTQIYDGSKYELNNDIKNYQNSINPPQPGPHMDYLKSFKKSYI